MSDYLQKDMDARNKCVLVTIQTLLQNDAISHSEGSYNQSELTKANALLDSLSSLLNGETTTADHNQDEL